MKIKTKLKELDFSQIALNSNRNSPSQKSPSSASKRKTIFHKQGVTLKKSQQNNTPYQGVISHKNRYQSLEKVQKLEQSPKLRQINRDQQTTIFDGYTVKTLEENQTSLNNTFFSTKARLKSSQLRTATQSSNTNNSNTTASNDSPIQNKKQPFLQQLTQKYGSSTKTTSLQDYVDSFENSPTRYRLYSSIQQDKSIRNLHTSIDFLPSKTPLNQSTSLTRNEQRLDQYKLPYLDVDKRKENRIQSTSLTSRNSSSKRFNLKKTFLIQSSYQAHMNSSKQITSPHSLNTTSNTSLHRKSLQSSFFLGGKDTGRQSILDMAEEELQQDKFYQFLGQIILSESEFNIYLDSFKNNTTVFSLKHFLDTFSKQERRFNKYVEEISKKVLANKFDLFSLIKQKERCIKLIEETTRIHSSMLLSAKTTLERDENNYFKMDKITQRAILSIKEYVYLFENLISFIDQRIKLQKYIQSTQNEFNTKNQILTKKLAQNVLDQMSHYEQIWKNILQDFEHDFQYIQSLSLFNVIQLQESLSSEILSITHTPVNQFQNILNEFIDSARNFLFRVSSLMLSYFLTKPFLSRVKENKQQLNEEKKQMINDVRQNYFRMVNSLELYFYEKLSLKSSQEVYQKEVVDFGLPSLYLLMEVANLTGLKGQQILQNIASLLVDLKSIYKKFNFCSRFYILPADKSFFQQMLVFLETIESQAIIQLSKHFALLKAELNMLQHPVDYSKSYKFKQQQTSIQNLIFISNKIEENQKLRPKIFTSCTPESLLAKSQEFVEQFEKEINMLIQAAQPYEDEIIKEQQERDVSTLSNFIEGITFVKPSYEIFLHFFREIKQYSITDIFEKLKANKIDIIQNHNLLFENFMFYYLKKNIDFQQINKLEWEIKQFISQILQNSFENNNNFINAYQNAKKLNTQISLIQDQFKQQNYAFTPLINVFEQTQGLVEKYELMIMMFNISENICKNDSKQSVMPNFQDFKDLINFVSNYSQDLNIDEFNLLFKPISDKINLGLSQIQQLDKFLSIPCPENQQVNLFIQTIQKMCNKIIDQQQIIVNNSNQSQRANLINFIGEYLAFKREKIVLLQQKSQTVYIFDYSQFQAQTISLENQNNNKINQQDLNKISHSVQYNNLALLQKIDNQFIKKDNKITLKPLQKKPLISSDLQNTTEKNTYQKNNVNQNMLQLNINSITLQQPKKSQQLQSINTSLTYSKNDGIQNIETKQKDQTALQIQKTSQQNQQISMQAILQQIKQYVINQFGIIKTQPTNLELVKETLTKQIQQIKIIDKKIKSINTEISEIYSPNKLKNLKQERVLRFQTKKQSIFIYFDSPFQSYDLTIFDEQNQKLICKVQDFQSGLQEAEIYLDQLCNQISILFYKTQLSDQFDRIHFKLQAVAYSFLPNFLDISLVPLNFKQHEFINVFFVSRKPEMLEQILQKDSIELIKFRDLQSQQDICFSQSKLSKENICYHLPHDIQDKQILLYINALNQLSQEILNQLGIEIYIYMRKEFMKAGKSVTKIEISQCNFENLKQKNIQLNKNNYFEWEIAEYENTSSSIKVLNKIQLQQ
ncbi:hypothetical protein TTHERM_01108560 (macronuclear) [Tetrahymena thermophila SB210]|uniref:Uncharacterized protein n=1 Tax=Tetrahymena thermophila (strain SB210) TaxID=312017 RepID=Q22B99_TETTS|nr:hypothetical protein TTHERM_01108560 [Tetrahymena thermophila SB210]EAR82554.2 hypothetical protein TTHERM_01108560 [Tetrahymena thermophila SB210]|eukprot:XP_001030217.2 hypothetical protein TTHERM_01108560 [Tetrahymena thermophila SB210]